MKGKLYKLNLTGIKAVLTIEFFVHNEFISKNCKVGRMSFMNVQYQGGFRTQAIHIDSHNQIITDAPKDNQGNGEAFSPTDLLSTSLASCMLTIMAMKAKSLNLKFGAVEVKLEKKMTQAPRKVGEIVLHFDWKGLDQRVSSEQLAILKEAGLNCPVYLSLSPEVAKTLHW